VITTASAAASHTPASSATHSADSGTSAPATVSDSMASATPAMRPARSAPIRQEVRSVFPGQGYSTAWLVKLSLCMANDRHRFGSQQSSLCRPVPG
jgi:hypothetical protein